MSRGEYTIGFECELDGVSSATIAPTLIRDGLWKPSNDSTLYGSTTRAHRNHCDCSGCKWGGSKIRAHTDSSCSGELVSDPIPWPDPTSEALLTHLASILAEHGSRPGMRAGFHIHVGFDHLTPKEKERVIDYFTLYEPQFAVFARQSLAEVRHYNYWLSQPGARGGYYSSSQRVFRPDAVEFKKHGTNLAKGWNLATRNHTFEFRMWNSVVEAWRMHMAIDMSCSFIDAAVAAPHIATDSDAPRTGALIDFLFPHMDPTAFGYAVRHLAVARSAA